MTVVVMGVAGSGKSTVAIAVAEHLGVPFKEGDDLHPAANVAKMAAGIPLDDADRAPWLALVRAWIQEHPDGVITCSALKRAYRDQLRGPGVRFVCLVAPREVLLERLEHRTGHYMHADMLDSQLATFEPPQPDETDVVQLDDTPTPDQVVAATLRALGAPLDAG